MTNTTDKSVDPMSLQRTRGEKGKFDTNEKWQKKVEESNKVQETELKNNNKELQKQRSIYKCIKRKRHIVPLWAFPIGPGLGATWHRSW